MASGTRAFRAYSGGASTPRSFANSTSAPSDSSKFGSIPVTSPSQYSPRSDAGGQQDWKSQRNKDLSVGRMIDRPSSQPNGHAAGPGGTRFGIFDPLATPTTVTAHQEERRVKEPSSDQIRDRVSSFDFLGRQAQIAQLERQQRLEQEQLKKTSSQGSPQEDRLNGTTYPFLTQSSVFTEPAVSAPRPGKESAVDRLLERSFQIQNEQKTRLYPEGSVGDLREKRQRLSQQNQKYSPTATRQSYLDNSDDRQAQTYLLNPLSRTVSQEGKTGTDGLSPQVRALLNDNKQRAGRLSPLPQAVQGAQGQKRGPSTDPTIKNEFSRMFAGIGSGVGSAGLNSGASTPFPPSPKQNSEADRPTPLSGRHDLNEPRARNGSRIGKRARKVKDDEAKDIEVIEDRALGGMNGTRTLKKSRLGQSHHHHTSDQ